MTRLLLIFCFVFAFGYVFTTSWAIQTPPVNEMETMLKKIRSHTQAVGQATKAAHEVSEKLVEEKVAEKQELKQAVVEAEAKTEAMTNTMLFMGVDTALIHMDTASIINMLKLNGMR